MNLHGHEHQADDQARQHGEDARTRSTPKADHKLGSDDATPAGLGEERGVIVLWRYSPVMIEYAEHEGEQSASCRARRRRS